MALTGNDVEGISANMLLVVIIETHFAAQIEVPISVAAKWQSILIQSPCVCFVIDECFAMQRSFLQRSVPTAMHFFTTTIEAACFCVGVISRTAAVPVVI